MVRIHCEDGKGVLVRLLAEVEGLHLSITHVNAIPFPACTVVITVTAKFVRTRHCGFIEMKSQKQSVFILA
uniref:ACT domain-containing protein n=1 Tax=Aegilops tauschii subsp. strangulata TaxID=200361 RepID=A0A453H1P6_AEGTS